MRRSRIRRILKLRRRLRFGRSRSRRLSRRRVLRIPRGGYSL